MNDLVNTLRYFAEIYKIVNSLRRVLQKNIKDPDGQTVARGNVSKLMAADVIVERCGYLENVESYCLATNRSAF